jgi:hypothetical protein
LCVFVRRFCCLHQLDVDPKADVWPSAGILRSTMRNVRPLMCRCTKVESALGEPPCVRLPYVYTSDPRRRNVNSAPDDLFKARPPGTVLAAHCWRSWPTPGAGPAKRFVGSSQSGRLCVHHGHPECPSRPSNYGGHAIEHLLATMVGDGDVTPTPSNKPVCLLVQQIVFNHQDRALGHLAWI